MKKAINSNQSAPDYSGLSTDELLAIIAEKDARLAESNDIIATSSERIAKFNEHIELAEHSIASRDKQISNQQRLIKLLE
ncbi:hypothetical protein FT643_22470 [Ketobacter sp. MCCC 1A13808]|uniref:hypothetical protein n=1 Tax=Ketobacter sp. MCCC 1A13808 TaxID=2602738 RepID=UPI000F162085|nr:hypothetical protein [Ketobacter sp. MCCC 1A13808]MVF14904.1 hypothetical protein [Ketobacter sp. MCCC 1A13808]RLP52182.1 MAG: hypothetical protein D6160_22225 [Ketobacter sp.]